MKDKEIVQKYEDHFQVSEDLYGANKKQAKSDTNFSHGDQWDASAKAQRSQPGKERPCLVVNKTDPLVRRVVNEFIGQKISLTAKPSGDIHDPMAGQIVSAVLASIEKNSRATKAYKWAMDCSTRGGIGYIRVDDEFANDNTFDHTIKIKSIRNPGTVSYCTDCEDLYGFDAYQVSIKEPISHSKALRKGLSLEKLKKADVNTKVWNKTENNFEAAEFFYKDETLVKKYLVQLGPQKTVVTEKELQEIITTNQLQPEAVAKMILDSRKVPSNVVYQCYIVNGILVADPVELNGSFIPVIRFVGRECLIDDKLDLRGLTRNSRDSNQMYNVMTSLLVERIGLAARVPYIGAQGTFNGFEDDWKNINKSNDPYIEYNPISVNGQVLPGPSRNDTTSADPGIQNYLAISAEDIKATSSLYDASLGATSNETSGKAINARASLGTLATSDFADNALMAIEQVGRVVLDMIPRVLSPEQIAQMMGDDFTAKRIDGKTIIVEDKKGKQAKIDIYSGKFDIQISARANDLTRREHTMEALSMLSSKSQTNAELLADVVVSNMDIKDGDKIANRFKALLPAEVIAAEEGLEKDNPELDALQKHSEKIIAEMQAVQQEATAKLQDLELKVKDKTMEYNLKKQELELKEREVEIKERESIAKISTEEVPGKLLPMVLEKLGQLEQKDELVEEQLEMITSALENLAAGQQVSGEMGTSNPPTQPLTEGTSLPPEEDVTLENSFPAESNFQGNSGETP